MHWINSLDFSFKPILILAHHSLKIFLPNCLNSSRAMYFWCHAFKVYNCCWIRNSIYGTAYLIIGQWSCTSFFLMYFTSWIYVQSTVHSTADVTQDHFSFSFLPTKFWFSNSSSQKGWRCVDWILLNHPTIKKLPQNNGNIGVLAPGSSVAQKSKEKIAIYFWLQHAVHLNCMLESRIYVNVVAVNSKSWK